MCTRSLLLSFCAVLLVGCTGLSTTAAGIYQLEKKRGLARRRQERYERIGESPVCEGRR